MMSDVQILEVVRAHMEGKKIQCRALTEYGLWGSRISDRWNFECYEYRVLPEPRKPRELWLLKSVTDGYWRECDEKPIYDIGNILHVRVIEE